MKTRTLILAALAAVAVVGGATAASAYVQRDPAYAKARAAGQVGEQTDGYLGVVGGGDDNLRKLVQSINIQRKAAYIRGAGSSATAEQFAFVSGCNLIAQTKPGEKYQAPDGSWKTRGAGPAERDPRCV
ncbi:YdbL family protein [Sphingomonas japonica]|uniref:DUF1318 domain-containing protein n=1 Tax=Sphingomonas japonica TaxID=511662 RepID=A0ABX0U6J4_9SPHN|nr:YdbL family protein [Sphingomonas japonica]NIJ24377.1 hypothetical protein [Sphingomonas japonica]